MIRCNYFRFPDRIKLKFKEFKYILAVVVDPEADPIEKDDMEQRIISRFEKADKNLSKIRRDLRSTRQKQDSLFDRIGLLEEGQADLRQGQRQIREVILNKERWAHSIPLLSKVSNLHYLGF